MVSDCAGKLYNKDTILEYLLPEGEGSLGMTKADCDAVLKGRVKGLKDVVEVRFQAEEGEEERSASARRGARSGKKVQNWICPITNKVLGSNVKAVYLVPCGHAFAEVAIKEMAETKCLQVYSHLLNFELIMPMANNDSVTNLTTQRTSLQYYQQLQPIWIACQPAYPS